MNETKNSLRSDSRGAGFTEYVVLVSVVGLVAAAALAALGAPLLQLFFYSQTILNLPVP